MESEMLRRAERLDVRDQPVIAHAVRCRVHEVDGLDVIVKAPSLRCQHLRSSAIAYVSEYDNAIVTGHSK
jgi:hypothetical protein